MCGLVDILGSDLIGVYLHGSLAMGCFNPRGSDLDLLVVTRRRMTADVWKRVAELCVRYARRPTPIEISVMRLSQLRPFRHPMPFDLHFGCEWKPFYMRILKSGRWRAERRKVKRDADLAGHCMVLRHRGVRIQGAAIRSVVPAVPGRMYLDSVLRDHAWGWRHVLRNPRGMGTYWVLNACRTAAYLSDGRVRSKAEGGRWGMRRLPASVRPVIRRALRVYEAGAKSGSFARPELAAFGRAVETYSRGRCAFPGS